MAVRFTGSSVAGLAFVARAIFDQSGFISTDRRHIGSDAHEIVIESDFFSRLQTRVADALKTTSFPSLQETRFPVLLVIARVRR